MSRSSSNIRVFVQFEKSTVFAGEDVECTITFKNVDQAKPPRRPERAPSGRRASIQSRDIPERTTHSRNPSWATSIPSPRQATGHRPTLSLNVGPDTEKPTSPQPAPLNGSPNVTMPKHTRRISIISIGNDGVESTRGAESPTSATRVAYRHSRSTSLQSVPGKQGVRSPTMGMRSVTQPSPLSESTTLPTFYEAPNQLERTTSETQSMSAGARAVASQVTAPSQHQPFKFPPSEPRPEPQERSSTLAEEPSKTNETGSTEASKPPSTAPESVQQSSISPRVLENITRATSPPLSRVFALPSVEGTPRSSAEFYSMSNHSEETLASEYPMQAMNKLLDRPVRGGTPTPRIPVTRQQGSETLMMGYAKITGNFILDGSLVNPAPFEEIKRKAVLGGQGGGGVVGIERSNRNTGLFGSLGWGSIGESIGGMLGNSELSSIKEMRGQASSKSIPLLSTPQSILFVDLRLAPGETRSYRYSFTLPNGLPPTHRGRAMKISYQLVIGTQRPTSLRNQKSVRHTEIPFRVFGGINNQGDPLGHDLMSPYIILKDEARTYPVDPSTSPTTQKAIPFEEQDQNGAEDFATYVAALLKNSKSKTHEGLLSPTEPVSSPYIPSQPQTPTSPTTPTHTKMRPKPRPSTQDLIDQAIHLSTRPSASNPTQSPTHFTIARASIPVATLHLPRPAFRLGDPLNFVLDFAPSARSAATTPIPAYAASVSLESYESVSPSLALRSAPSIERATRRVWARDVHCVLWADRVSVRWQIPSAGADGLGSAAGGSSGGGPTPEFLTSGVGLSWRVRLEIVVARQPPPPPAEADGEAADNGGEDEAEGEEARTPTTATATIGGARTAVRKTRAEELLEEVARDERGSVLAAMENLACESFEVCVPIRVYGAVPLRGLDSGGGEVGGGGEKGRGLAV